MTTATSVDPLLPLTLLEAVRDADRPEGEADAEYVPELLNKRLGATDTVYTQIRRYNDAVRRGQPISSEEVRALAKLIARRPDAPDLFRAAGRETARVAYGRLSALGRSGVRILPRFVARPLARRQARRIVAKYFRSELPVDGTTAGMEISAADPLADGAEETGREYYNAALDELLSLLSLN